MAKIARPTFTGFCSTEILPIRPGPRLDKNYLAHYLMQPKVIDLATSRSAGANLPRLSPSELVKFQLPLPPIDEQRRIANILDSADALRAKCGEAITHLDALTRSMFLDMFGDTTRLSCWPVADFGDLIGDTRLGLIRNSESFGHDFQTPYVRMNAITAKGELSSLGLQRTSVSSSELEVYALRPGDLLFNTRNSRELVGKSALVEEDSGWVFNNNLMRIRLLPDVNPQYMAQLLLSDYGAQQLDRRKSGTTSVFAIYYKDLRSLQVPVPPISLQKAFGDRRATIVRLRTGYRRQGSTLDALVSSLQDSAFKGKL